MLRNGVYFHLVPEWNIFFKLFWRKTANAIVPLASGSGALMQYLIKEWKSCWGFVEARLRPWVKFLHATESLSVWEMSILSLNIKYYFFIKLFYYKSIEHNIIWFLITNLIYWIFFWFFSFSHFLFECVNSIFND